MRRVTFFAGALAILRWLYALFFIAIGGLIFWSLATGTAAPFRQPTREAEAFIAALSATPFFDALLGASYVAGGFALATPRTIPLGLVLLAPSVIVILLFHVCLSGQTVIGVATAAIWSVLAFRHRAGFRALWNHSA